MNKPLVMAVDESEERGVGAAVVEMDVMIFAMEERVLLAEEPDAAVVRLFAVTCGVRVTLALDGLTGRVDSVGGGFCV